MLHLLTPNCFCAFRKKVYIFTKSAKLCISSPPLSVCHCFKISAPPAVFARYILNSHCSNGCLLNTALWRKQNKPYKALEIKQKHHCIYLRTFQPLRTEFIFSTIFLEDFTFTLVIRISHLFTYVYFSLKFDENWLEVNEDAKGEGMNSLPWM